MCQERKGCSIFQNLHWLALPAHPYLRPPSTGGLRTQENLGHPVGFNMWLLCQPAGQQHLPFSHILCMQLASNYITISLAPLCRPFLNMQVSKLDMNVERSYLIFYQQESAISHQPLQAGGVQHARYKFTACVIIIKFSSEVSRRLNVQLHASPKCQWVLTLKHHADAMSHHELLWYLGQMCYARALAVLPMLMVCWAHSALIISVPIN